MPEPHILWPPHLLPGCGAVLHILALFGFSDFSSLPGWLQLELPTSTLSLCALLACGITFVSARTRFLVPRSSQLPRLCFQAWDGSWLSLVPVQLSRLPSIARQSSPSTPVSRPQQPAWMAFCFQGLGDLGPEKVVLRLLRPSLEVPCLSMMDSKPLLAVLAEATCQS